MKQRPTAHCGRSWSRRGQRGSAMLEYVLGAMLVSLVLFVGNPSVLDRLMEAIRSNHSARAHAIGSPLVGSSIKP